MVIGDGEAGRTAVECLIEQGKLVPDFWFRIKDRHRDHSVWDNTDQCNRQVSDAVRFAMGCGDVELPIWARQEYTLPDTTWIRENDQQDLPTVEPYYTVRALRETFAKCYSNVPPQDPDLKIVANSFKNLSLRTWQRIVPHFIPEISARILNIQNSPNQGHRRHSKKYETNHLLSGVMIRDEVFREFYDRQGEEGLKQIFHGIGRKAILGVGAMLFLSGEHDDLLYTAEQLSDELNHG